MAMKILAELKKNLSNRETVGLVIWYPVVRL